MMINRTEHPGPWATLMYELEDARNHLANLIIEIENQPDYDGAELGIELGHVYAHLNRAWFLRNCTEELSEAQWEAASQLPRDLEPVWELK